MQVFTRFHADLMQFQVFKGGFRRSFIKTRLSRDRHPRPQHRGAAMHTQPVVTSEDCFEHTVHTVHTCAHFLAWLHTFSRVVHFTFGVTHTGQYEESGIKFSRKNCACLYFRFFDTHWCPRRSTLHVMMTRSVLTLTQ